MKIEFIDSITSARQALEKSHSVAQIMIEQTGTQHDAQRSKLYAEIMLDYIAEAEEYLTTIK